ncbi:hypothetical protein HY570_01805 [Candidatus Micrarchaeota archaeon]|nr:hypothetical protein [Candidatus Micrarchaeota archaeon]
MSRYSKTLSIKEIERPLSNDIEEEVAWLCKCLGFSDEKEDVATDIFKELLTALYEHKGISTKEVKTRRQVTRGAIVYHLNQFMRSGLVVKKGRAYYLRELSLSRTLEEVEEDFLRMIKRMRDIAKDIDDQMTRQE